MRLHYLTILLLPLTTSALQVPSILVPFYEAIIGTNDTSIASHDLLKRDGNCPANYNSCSALSGTDGDGACCIAGSTCTTDAARIVACCPTGAKCTGTVPYSSAVAATGGGVFGSSATTTTTSSTTAATATITSAASLVDNAFFPFPYIPTTYVNSASCMIAYSACQSNYAACTADLEGSGFAVTIVAPGGGGVTVSPTVQNLGTSSAVSICSSLSNKACYGIVSTNCNSFGAGTFDAGTGTSAPGSRITAGCYAGVVVGVGAGIMGMM